MVLLGCCAYQSGVCETCKSCTLYYFLSLFNELLYSMQRWDRDLNRKRCKNTAMDGQDLRGIATTTMGVLLVLDILLPLLSIHPMLLHQFDNKRPSLPLQRCYRNQKLLQGHPNQSPSSSPILNLRFKPTVVQTLHQPRLLKGLEKKKKKKEKEKGTEKDANARPLDSFPRPPKLHTHTSQSSHAHPPSPTSHSPTEPTTTSTKSRVKMPPTEQIQQGSMLPAPNISSISHPQPLTPHNHTQPQPQPQPQSQSQLQPPPPHLQAANAWFGRSPPQHGALLPEYRYCSKEGFVKPLRAHHCRSCGKVCFLFSFFLPFSISSFSFLCRLFFKRTDQYIMDIVRVTIRSSLSMYVRPSSQFFLPRTNSNAYTHIHRDRPMRRRTKQTIIHHLPLLVNTY